MKFMLLLRGDPAAFESRSPLQQQEVIASHGAWAAQLAQAGQLLDGAGFGPHSTRLTPGTGSMQVQVASLRGDAQAPSGFYLIEAATEGDAVALARQCPALAFGETVEVLGLVR